MSITAVPGLRVGHFTDPRRPTGCSVVLAPPGTVGGVDVRGAAPGTRETELLSPLNAVQQVHAVLLAGGSAYGLDAAGGVMRWLEEQGIGIQVGRRAGGTEVRVPIVPAAILFDLNIGDARIRPDAQAGYAACQAATASTPEQGNVGAGAGASVGKLFGFDRAMRGGIGGASIQVGGITVGALIAVNAMGDVVDPGTGNVIAGARCADGTALLDTMAALRRGELPPTLQAGIATTIGVIGTDAKLDKAGANKLAQMAHDGLARAINPVHTQADGDTLFALATGGSGRAASLTLLGALAAEVTALAVLRAVRAATTLDAAGLPRLPAAGDFGTLRTRTPAG
jgi:L-aminopeptidase/D-esterase-like protein